MFSLFTKCSHFPLEQNQTKKTAQGHLILHILLKAKGTSDGRPLFVTSDLTR